MGGAEPDKAASATAPERTAHAPSGDPGLRIAELARSQAIWVALIGVLGGGVGVKLIELVASNKSPPATGCSVDPKVLGAMPDKLELVRRRAMEIGAETARFSEKPKDQRTEKDIDRLKGTANAFDRDHKDVLRNVSILLAQCR